MTVPEKNNQPSSSTGIIARSAGAVGGAVMCSRVLGLIREQLFAGLFGAGTAYDAFVVAFRIPNLLRDLFGEGALSAAFVTVFSDYDTNKGTKATWELASTVLIFFAIFLSLITLIGMYCAEPIVNLLAPTFQAVEGKTALTTMLTRIMFPFLTLVSLSAVVMGMLNTKGKFFIPALASSFFNLGSIIGGVSLAFLFPYFDKPAIAGMAWGTLIGGAMQLCIQIPTLRRTGFTFTPRFNIKDPGLHRILYLMVPATIGLSATQLNLFINTNFASSCAEGSVSWLQYAFRLVQLPIGVFGVALSIAVMPIMAKHAAVKNISALKESLCSSLVLVFSLTIPATFGLILLAEPIIKLIFEHGVFTSFDTARTAEALQLYAIGLFAYSAIKIMVPAFYAINNTRFPVIGSFLGVTVNLIIINLIIEQLQHKGIALSTSCSIGVNFLFLGVALYKKLDGLPLMHLGKGLLKIGIATLMMATIIITLQQWITSWMNGSLLTHGIGVFFLIGCGAGTYGISLQLLKLPEFILLTQKLGQRFSRS